MSGNDKSELIELIAKLQDRVEILESQLIRHKAEAQALLVCLRDFTKSDSNQMLERFAFLANEIHQKHLEGIEKFNPYWAGIMDKRKPDELP